MSVALSTAPLGVVSSDPVHSSVPTRQVLLAPVHSRAQVLPDCSSQISSEHRKLAEPRAEPVLSLAVLVLPCAPPLSVSVQRSSPTVQVSVRVGHLALHLPLPQVHTPSLQEYEQSPDESASHCPERPPSTVFDSSQWDRVSPAHPDRHVLDDGPSHVPSLHL